MTDTIQDVELTETEAFPAEDLGNQGGPVACACEPSETQISSDASAPPAFDNNITFDVRFRGYDRGQIDDYILALTADYNAICARCDDLERENIGLRNALSGLAKFEG